MVGPCEFSRVRNNEAYMLVYSLRKPENSTSGLKVISNSQEATKTISNLIQIKNPHPVTKYLWQLPHECGLVTSHHRSCGCHWFVLLVPWWRAQSRCKHHHTEISNTFFHHHHMRRLPSHHKLAGWPWQVQPRTVTRHLRKLPWLRQGNWQATKPCRDNKRLWILP